MKRGSVGTHATHFLKALSNIEPDKDAEHAKSAHKEVSDVLKADDRLKDLGISPVLIGSYKREVSIKRVKDVDVFVRLENAGKELWPGSILDHITDLLEDAFDGRVTRQHRSVMVDFPAFDLTVDAVIARPCVGHPAEHWQIPERIDKDGNARWIETNPTEMTVLTTDANQRFLLGGAGRGVYVPVVKLMRQIRRTWVVDQPGGYYFEVLTWHAFQDKNPEESTVAEYLTLILRAVADSLPAFTNNGPPDPTMDGKTIKSKATPIQIQAASERIAEAADLAERALGEEDPCRSAKLWQELLGTTQGTDTAEFVFPMPEYCNADGTERQSQSIDRGSPAVPAGSDRYA